MVVGVLQIELQIDGGGNLKDKRRVVKHLKDRLHADHLVSVAEVDAQDNPRVARLGIAVAASAGAACQRTLDKVLEQVRACRGCYVSDHASEVLHGGVTE